MTGTTHPHIRLIEGHYWCAQRGMTGVGHGYTAAEAYRDWLLYVYAAWRGVRVVWD